MSEVVSGKNTAKNLHICQWERDIILALFVLLVLFNIGQVVYMYRSRIYNAIHRVTGGPIRANDEDPIINIRE